MAASDDKTKQLLMHSVTLGRSCEACFSRGTPHLCTHNENVYADWKDPKRIQRVAKIYQACGHMGTLMAELFSTIGNQSGCIFEKEHYEYLIRPTESKERIDAVFIGVDPAYIGDCEFAITAIGLTKVRPGDPSSYKYQVIAMCAEKINANEERLNSIIYKLLLSLRENPRVQSPYEYIAPFIVAIEGVTADVMHLGPKFRDTARDLGIELVLMRELKVTEDGQGIGVPKNQVTTKTMTFLTKALLAQKSMSIASDCLAVSSDLALPPATLHDHVVKLCTQLGQFKVYPNGRIDGKLDGRVNDDLAISTMTAFLWSQAFCCSVKAEYTDFKARFPALFDTWREGSRCTYLPQK